MWCVIITEAEKCFFFLSKTKNCEVKEKNDMYWTAERWLQEWMEKFLYHESLKGENLYSLTQHESLGSYNTKLPHWVKSDYLQTTCHLNQNGELLMEQIHFVLGFRD